MSNEQKKTGHFTESSFPSNLKRLEFILRELLPQLRQSFQTIICETYLPLQSNMLNAIKQVEGKTEQEALNVFNSFNESQKLQGLTYPENKLIEKKASGRYQMTELNDQSVKLSELYHYLHAYGGYTRIAKDAIDEIYAYCLNHIKESTYQEIAGQIKTKLEPIDSIHIPSSEVLKFPHDHDRYLAEVRVIFQSSGDSPCYEIPIDLVDDTQISASIILNFTIKVEENQPLHFANTCFLNASLFQAPDNEHNELLLDRCEGHLHMISTAKCLQLRIKNCPKLTLTLTHCKLDEILIEKSGSTETDHHSSLHLDQSQVNAIKIKNPLNCLTITKTRTHIEIDSTELASLTLSASETSLFITDSVIKKILFDHHLHLIATRLKLAELIALEPSLMACYLDQCTIDSTTEPTGGLYQEITYKDCSKPDSNTVQIIIATPTNELQFEVSRTIAFDQTNCDLEKSFEYHATMLQGNSAARYYYKFKPDCDTSATQVALHQSLPMLLVQLRINPNQTALISAMICMLGKQDSSRITTNPLQGITELINAFLFDQVIRQPKEYAEMVAKLSPMGRLTAADWLDCYLSKCTAPIGNEAQVIRQYSLDSNNLKLLSQMFCLLLNYKPSMRGLSLKSQLHQEVCRAIQLILTDKTMDFETAVEEISQIIAETKRKHPKAFQDHHLLSTVFELIRTTLQGRVKAIRTCEQVNNLLMELEAIRSKPASFEQIITEYQENKKNLLLPEAVTIAVQKMQAQYLVAKHKMGGEKELQFYVRFAVSNEARYILQLCSRNYRQHQALEAVQQIAQSYQPRNPHFGVGKKKKEAMASILADASAALQSNDDLERQSQLFEQIKTSIAQLQSNEPDFDGGAAKAESDELARVSDPSRHFRGIKDMLELMAAFIDLRQDGEDTLTKVNTANSSAGGAKPSADELLRRSMRGYVLPKVVTPPVQEMIAGRQSAAGLRLAFSPPKPKQPTQDTNASEQARIPPLGSPLTDAGKRDPAQSAAASAQEPPVLK